jgi:hypothetical protein
MKLDKKTLVWGGVVLLLLVISLVVSNYNTLSIGDASKSCVESEINKDVLCFENKVKLQPFAITSNFKDEYAPNEAFRVGEDLYYYESQYPFRSARIYISEVVNGQERIYDSWDVTDSINSKIPDPAYTGYSTKGLVGGELLKKYIYNVMRMQVPSKAGTYIFRDDIYDKNGENLDSDYLVSKRGFSVLNSVQIKVVDDVEVTCEPFESNWKVYEEISNGEIRIKEFGQECDGEKSVSAVNWKTVCDSGYLADGSNTKVINERSSCVKEVEDTPKDDGGSEDDSGSDNSETGNDNSDTGETDDEKQIVFCHPPQDISVTTICSAQYGEVKGYCFDSADSCSESLNGLKEGLGVDEPKGFLGLSMDAVIYIIIGIVVVLIGAVLIFGGSNEKKKK